MINITAPAKINLTLEVLRKRSDGFHEIRSVMQTINLCDRLSFQPGDSLEFKSNSPGWVAEKSLVAKAACLLQETSPPKVDSRGAVITVEKHIPLVGGLGGDSSDAAATLRGLNQLWKLALPKNKLLELACKLGSDVAFFLDGGTALAEGRGEIITPLPPLPPMWVVLVLHDVKDLQLEEKTRRLYERLKVSHYTHGQITRQLAARLREGGGLPADLLFNVFEKVAFTAFPGLSDCRESILKAGASQVHLAGSGPTLFTLHKDKTQAEKVYRRLNEQKIECYLTETFTPGQSLQI